MWWTLLSSHSPRTLLDYGALLRVSVAFNLSPKNEVVRELFESLLKEQVGALSSILENGRMTKSASFPLPLGSSHPGFAVAIRLRKSSMLEVLDSF